jgi:hypothetical protein
MDAKHRDMTAMLDAHRERMMACLGKMEAVTEKTEPDSGMMQSTEEHQEIPKEEATVMLVREPRKKRKHRQKKKDRSWGNGGSRRKSATASRKVSRCANVAWRKRNLFRNVQTQSKCGPWKELAVTCREMTHCAKVARGKGNIVRNRWTWAMAEQGIQKVWTRHEGRRTVKGLGGGRP